MPSTNGGTVEPPLNHTKSDTMDFTLTPELTDIEGAEVRAFGQLPGGRLLPIGRATTGDEGTLRLLLPPEL